VVSAKGWEPFAADGRGQIKRLVLIIGMGLCVPFLLLTEEPPEAERVDERTLLLGEASDEQQTQMVGVSPLSFWDLVRMVLVLGAVVGLIYLVFYLLKRAGGGRTVRNDLIKVIGTQPLAGNRAIYLVQVGAQVFMIGAGSESITLLGEITDKETVDAMVLSATEANPSRRSFSEALASFIQGGEGQSVELLRRQRERLQRLRP
jgi:flagellar protein FliO/FliZ